MHGSHDTVMVLYQNEQKDALGKPKISETPVLHGPKSLKSTLPFQNRLEYHKPAIRPSLANDYAVSDELYILGGDQKLQVIKKDMAWCLARLNFDNDSVQMEPDIQTMPSWSASNSLWTSEILSIKSVAFLPVIPYPVTDLLQFTLR